MIYREGMVVCIQVGTTDNNCTSQNFHVAKNFDTDNVLAEMTLAKDIDRGEFYSWSDGITQWLVGHGYLEPLEVYKWTIQVETKVQHAFK